jgi:hypothetical protein
VRNSAVIAGRRRRVAQPRQELDAEIMVNRSALPVQTLIENNPVYELRLRFPFRCRQG